MRPPQAVQWALMGPGCGWVVGIGMRKREREGEEEWGVYVGILLVGDSGIRRWGGADGYG